MKRRIYGTKRLNAKWFRREVVVAEYLAEIEYDKTGHTATYETFLSLPGRLAYAHLLARCYGNQTDVFCNNKYLTTFFRR